MNARRFALLFTLLALAACGRSPLIRPHSTGTAGLETKAPPAEPTPEMPGRSTVNNGSDLRSPQDGAAWFIGDKPFTYCVRLSPDFGVPEAEAKRSVQDAVKEWTDLLELGAFNNPKRHPERAVDNEVDRISTLGIFRNECQGDEDLVFYLGERNKDVDKVGALYQEPFGFAAVRDYHWLTARATGFVWIRESKSLSSHRYPDWTTDRSGFYAVLLHEVGHVFGCGHVRNTVMDDRLAGTIWDQEVEGITTTDNSPAKKWPSLRQPHGRSFLGCDGNCPAGLPLAAGHFAPPDGNLGFVFKGPKAFGFAMHIGWLSPEDLLAAFTGSLPGLMKLMAPPSPWYIHMMRSKVLTTWDSIPIFQTARWRPFFGWRVAASHVPALHFAGTVKLSERTSIPLSVEMNMPDIGFRVLLWNGVQVVPIDMLDYAPLERILYLNRSR